MFSFLRQFRRANPDDRYFLAIDLGTDNVQCAVVRVEDRHGFVVGTASVQHEVADMQAGAVADIEAVTGTVDAAIRTATRMAGVRPEQAVFGMAGELTRGATHTIAYAREAATRRIDMTELARITQRVQQRAFSEMRAQLAEETGHHEVDIKLLYSAVLSAQVDGQRVENPIGFQGSSVELSVFQSFAPLVHAGALSTIAAELDLDLLATIPTSYAVQTALMAERPELSAVTIDVGAGTTDICLLRAGRDMGMQVFSVGGRSFTKRIAHDMAVPHHEAERMKLAYTSAQLTKKVGASIRRSMTSDIDVWQSGVQLALGDLAAGTPLPTQVYLLGGGTRLPGVAEALSTPDFVSQIPSMSGIRVISLVPEDIPGVVDETQTLKSVQDTALVALARAGMTMAGEESVLSGLLRQAVKMMRG